MHAVKASGVALAAALCAAGALAVTPAWADRGYGHGRHGYSGHASWGLGFGLLAGTAIVLAATEPRHVHYPPVVYVTPPAYAPPVVVVPRSVAVVPSPPAPAYVEPAWWYYCSRPAGYYPYVSSCPAGWMRVVPTPPG